MICYRDMTFCTRSEKCQNKECYRNFNEEMQKGAKEWMGDDAPVCFSDMRNNKCGYKNGVTLG